MYTIAYAPYAFYPFADEMVSVRDHPGHVLPSAEKSLPEPHSLPHVNGFLQPRLYQAGEWSWCRWDGKHEEAVSSALSDYRSGIGLAPIRHEDWKWFILDHKLQQQALAKTVPAYHPADRATLKSDAPCNRNEIKLATELLAFGHSLVVVEPMKQASADLTNIVPGEPVHAPSAPHVTTRWGAGVGDQAEFLPPLYIGHFRDAWYSLKLRNPE